MNPHMIEPAMNFDVTILIAIIGCVTGCISLLISLFSLWKERYCLKIHFLESESFYFDSITQKKFTSPHQAIIHMIIRNKSTSPITVFDSYIVVNGKYTRFEEYVDSNDIRIPQKHPTLSSNLIAPKFYTVIPMDKQFSLPLRLEARDAAEFIGFIPYFPTDNIDTIKVTVVLKPATKLKHKAHVTVKKYDY